jgi:fructokinase
MRIGIDLGGTKIELIALGEDGTELLRRRTMTPQGDYRATIRAVSELVERTEAASASARRVQCPALRD